MKCQRCGKDPAEWQCAVCGRIICEDCKKIIGGKVYCSDCLPKAEKVKEGKDKTLSSIKSAIISLIIILLGMGVVFFIGDRYISQFQTQYALPIIGALKGTGILLMAGIGFIIIILIMAYFVIKRKSL